MPEHIETDLLFIGGGIAGLWALARCRQAGYRCALLETGTLGGGQTRFAQGIIHGGTKYALTGKLTASSEAVADMPARWRACHQGRGEIDLTAARLLSDAHYLWTTRQIGSRLSGFFASKVMRSRSRPLPPGQRPPLFQHPDFKGHVYRLDEPVFDTLSLVRALAEPHARHIFMVESDSLRFGDGQLEVRTREAVACRFQYRRLVLCAGAANRRLLEMNRRREPAMQLRPLQMVVARADEGVLDERVFAHCLGASVNPRVTITTHRDARGRVVWYMGGQLAETGAGVPPGELVATAKRELAGLLPWVAVAALEWGVLAVDRAEMRQPGVSRPDSFTLSDEDGIITMWPTKLALAPALAEQLPGRLQQAGIAPSTAGDAGRSSGRLVYADYPWNDTGVWLT